MLAESCACRRMSAVARYFNREQCGASREHRVDHEWTTELAVEDPDRGDVVDFARFKDGNTHAIRCSAQQCGRIQIACPDKTRCSFPAPHYALPDRELNKPTRVTREVFDRPLLLIALGWRIQLPVVGRCIERRQERVREWERAEAIARVLPHDIRARGVEPLRAEPIVVPAVDKGTAPVHLRRPTVANQRFLDRFSAPLRPPLLSLVNAEWCKQRDERFPREVFSATLVSRLEIQRVREPPDFALHFGAISARE